MASSAPPRSLRARADRSRAQHLQGGGEVGGGGIAPPDISGWRPDADTERVKVWGANSAADGMVRDLMMPTEVAESYEQSTHRTSNVDETTEDLLSSIREQGIQKPIDLRTDGVKGYIADGHHRLEAARQLGMSEVPVRVRWVPREAGPDYWPYPDTYASPVEPFLKNFLSGSPQVAVPEDEVTLYHHTNPKAAEKIIAEQRMRGADDLSGRVFFSNVPGGLARDYGDSVIAVKVPESAVINKGEFPGQWGREATEYSYMVREADLEGRAFTLHQRAPTPDEYLDEVLGDPPGTAARAEAAQAARAEAAQALEPEPVEGVPPGWEDYYNDLISQPDYTGKADAYLPTDMLDGYKEYDRSYPLLGHEGADDPNYQVVKKVLAEQGIKNPITMDWDGENGLIVEGNHRLAVAKELGIDEMPVRFNQVKPGMIRRGDETGNPPRPLSPEMRTAITGEDPKLSGDVETGAGRWEHPYKGSYDIGLGSAKMHQWEIAPTDAPASETGTYYDREKTLYYDPARAHVEEGQFGPQVVPNDPNAVTDHRDLPDSGGKLWRGMSHEEYEQARERGYFESEGSYNIVGEGANAFQADKTFFSTELEQAAHYGTSFAPWQRQPTFTRPAHVIGIPDQPELPRGPLGVEPKSSEVGVPGRIPFDSVTDHWTGNVAGIHPGEIKNDYGYSGWGEPSRSLSPRVDVHWEPGEIPHAPEAPKPAPAPPKPVVEPKPVAAPPAGRLPVGDFGGLGKALPLFMVGAQSDVKRVDKQGRPIDENGNLIDMSTGAQQRRTWNELGDILTLGTTAPLVPDTTPFTPGPRRPGVGTQPPPDIAPKDMPGSAAGGPISYRSQVNDWQRMGAAHYDSGGGTDDMLLGGKPSKPVWAGEDQDPMQVWEFNRNWAKPSPTNWHTPLNPQEEKDFRKWLVDTKVLFNPDGTLSDWDARGYWKALMSGQPVAPMQLPGPGHPGEEYAHVLDDEFITPYSPLFSRHSRYSTPDNPVSGEWSPKDGKMYDDNGRLIFSYDKDYAQSEPGPPVPHPAPVRGDAGVGGVSPGAQVHGSGYESRWRMEVQHADGSISPLPLRQTSDGGGVTHWEAAYNPLPGDQIRTVSHGGTISYH